MSEGDWLQFRGDRALTGRSTLRGRISKPAVSWKHFVGGRETWLTVGLRGPAESTTDLLASDLDAENYPRLACAWRLGEPLHDLDGDGRLHAVSMDYYGTTLHKIGKFLPDEPGMQKLEFESGFYESGTAADASIPLFGRMFKRRDGAWQAVWKSEAIPLLFMPNVIAGDFDADGRLEVAATPWYDLWVLDAETGRQKAKARFTPPGTESGRAYGWLGAFDLDGDGRQEFVIVAQFENNLEVLGWRNDRLELLWHRLVERGITRKNTALRSGVSPVADLDGDGRLEIAVSLFNAGGDDLWHVVAFRGMTGEVALDFPGWFLTGLADVDRDGRSELFCTRARGCLVPEPSDELGLFRFREGRVEEIWRCRDAGFQTRPAGELPLHVNCDVASPRDVLLAGPVEPGGPMLFITRRIRDAASDRVELTFWRGDLDRGVASCGSLEGPGLEAAGIRVGCGGAPGVLVRSLSAGEQGGSLSCRDLEANPVLSRRAGARASPAVAARLDPASPPAVVVQAGGERIEAFHPPAAGRPVSVRWRVSGRGMSPTIPQHGSAASANGVLLADLSGDGTRMVLAAARAPEGHARLKAIRPDGSDLWHHDFHEVPGPLPPSVSLGGLILWFAGRFRHPARSDVLATVRRNTLHSEETFLLDGRTGEEVWHRTEGVRMGNTARACGGGWMAVYDHDGDGLDDVVSLFPDGVFVMKGETGRPLLDRSTRKETFPGVWTFYAAPAVMDFLGRGDLQILYGASSYMLGILDREGRPVWADGPGNGTPAILPGAGDVDGDGQMEILSPGHRREAGRREQVFHCYDAATGRIKWKLPLPGSCFGNNVQVFAASPTSPAVGDVDGDGRAECVFTVERTLFAVGSQASEEAGCVRWSLDFPDRLGPPAIADALGNGQAQVIVVCEDGYVYGVGPEDLAG
ncbi:MAG: VCBS repeat-containing protein [Planctomycetes bacterium]|nr:VCBS repeat-containing protein [Planctomycetota bacterium]